MTVVTLVLLAVAALAPALSLRRGAPVWLVAGLATAALAGAALTATATPAVHGVALAATLVLTTLAAVTGGAPAVLASFRIARRQPDAGPAPSPSPSPAGPEPPPGPLRGGRVIGLLERAAVAAAILSGWPEGIAVVLAVKGLARYPELREPQASEQFIIGTFTSVLWAIAVCGVGRGLLT
ncbi:hypothetical protein ACWDT5_00540 [Rhodococcus aetherivorans]|uniref:hypothetical protein n=1 Tax=Rhodococcus TaxID=1827 RepID=UPI0002D22187|nr:MULTISPECIES: hypothetical protein [Rhodococcus]NCL75485.1 hypothetical protein [Rhodococcus sp. YH1]OLL17819.1 hypothetical protein BKE56_021550 [Rhodococcus sp. M8]QPG46092.1 hypothetical protein ISO16_03140 [Rhodococcus sp. M8]USC12976.1 hypothetical protein KZJ41_14510 [Rhodococcus sp. 11-3]WKX01310.1 hypothetical protein Q3O43_13915 [Rhodococcus aetherivorans]